MMLAASASGVSDGHHFVERFDLLVDSGDGEIQLAGHLSRKPLCFAVGGELVLEAKKALAHIGKRGALFLQLQNERVAPVDIGAAVEVVADPAGERRELGPQRIRFVAEALRCDAEEAVRSST